jgi:hypothetical protein
VHNFAALLQATVCLLVSFQLRKQFHSSIPMPVPPWSRNGPRGWLQGTQLTCSLSSPSTPNRLLPVTKPEHFMTGWTTRWSSALTEDAGVGEAPFCTPVVLPRWCMFCAHVNHWHQCRADCCEPCLPCRLLVGGAGHGPPQGGGPLAICSWSGPSLGCSPGVNAGCFATFAHSYP